MTTIQAINIADISPNRFQPRKRFSDAALAELAASIKAKGLLQPVTIRPITDGSTPYELVMGERRLRATARNGSLTISCIVRELSDDESREIAIIENLQREDLAPIEEAQSVRDLVDALGSREKAAEKLNKSVGWVDDKLGLLKLPPEVQAMLDEKKLNTAQAKVIQEIDGAEKQVEAAKRAHRHNMTANSLRGMVQQDIKPKGKGARTASSDDRKQVTHHQLMSLLTRTFDGIDTFDLETLGDGTKGQKKREGLQRQLKLVRDRIAAFEHTLEHMPKVIDVPETPRTDRPRLTIKKAV